MDSVCEQSISLCDPDLGSKKDFEVFVKRHMKDAYLTALGLVGNREDALELSQEAFFRAYQHYDQLNAKGKFFPWFYQILRNLCFSHLRKRRIRRTRSLDNIEEGGAEPEIGDHFDPETIAARNESKDRLWRAIGQLDEKHREVIILRHFRHLSYDEMAQRLFCNRGTVTSRLFYARQRLKEILEGTSQPVAPGLGARHHSGASESNATGVSRVCTPDPARDVETAAPCDPGCKGGTPAPHRAVEPRKGGQMR